MVTGDVRIVSCLLLLLVTTLMDRVGGEAHDACASVKQRKYLPIKPGGNLRDGGFGSKSTREQVDPDSLSRYLVSYPCSGNSWLRLLLEYSSGVFTGSRYNDRTLGTSSLLPGEGIDSARVLVVKSHDFQPWFLHKKHKIIWLLRNPFDVIWSHFQLASTANHTGLIVRQELASDAARAKFVQFAFREMKLWTEHSLWMLTLCNSPGIVLDRNSRYSQLPEFQPLVVLYSNLRQNTTRELTTVLEFLGLQQKQFARRLDCAVELAEDIRVKRQGMTAAQVFRSFGGLACRLWRAIRQDGGEQVLRLLRLTGNDVFPKYGDGNLYCQ